MTIRARIESYDLFDQAILHLGWKETFRDFELIGLISGVDDKIKVSYCFKGCVDLKFSNKVSPDHYSMDDRLLELGSQDEPDYPAAYIWGVNHALVYPGWTLESNTEELIKLEKSYGYEFHKITFETNVFSLGITFNDLEIKEMI